MVPAIKVLVRPRDVAAGVDRKGASEPSARKIKRSEVTFVQKKAMVSIEAGTARQPIAVTAHNVAPRIYPEAIVPVASGKSTQLNTLLLNRKPWNPLLSW